MNSSSSDHSIILLHRLAIKFSSFNNPSVQSFPIRPTTHDNRHYKNRKPIITGTATPLQRADDQYCSVKFQTLRDCRLGISRYPNFDYNAEGGTGSAIGRRTHEDRQSATDGRRIISVSFDVYNNLYIPPLSGATTRFLGLPLPPFIRIDIVPQLLQGTIDEDTGKVDLEFRAKFMFSVGSIYRAPPLMVETMLTSVESTRNRGRGERLDGLGRCRLVGVATVDPIGDILMDSFLALPTECFAALNARISISENSS